MPNKFPLWKNLMILLIISFGFVYAAPNLFPPDPAIQLSGQSGAMVIDQAVPVSYTHLTLPTICSV